jgi:hypothetical protein
MFGGISCEYLNAGARTELCSLLTARDIANICRKARCTYAVIGMTQEKIAKRFSSMDEQEDIDLEKIFARLGHYYSDRTLTIEQWFSLVGLVFRNASIDLARRRGLTSSVDNCGTCSHLSLSNPFRCLISGESRAKGDQVCEDYLPVRVVFKPVTDERQIEAFTEKESILKAAEDERQDVDRLFVENIESALRTRALKEKQNTQRRTICTRQYNLFVVLRHVLETVDSKAEALKILARQLDVDEKMVRRDLQEIRTFLKKKGFEIFSSSF